jgi:hypothetical protein
MEIKISEKIQETINETFSGVLKKMEQSEKLKKFDFLFSVYLIIPLSGLFLYSYLGIKNINQTEKISKENRLLKEEIKQLNFKINKFENNMIKMLLYQEKYLHKIMDINISNVFRDDFSEILSSYSDNDTKLNDTKINEERKINEENNRQTNFDDEELLNENYY